MTTTQTAMTNGLRALLLTGDETDRGLARASFTANRLQPSPADEAPPPNPSMPGLDAPNHAGWPGRSKQAATTWQPTANTCTAGRRHRPVTAGAHRRRPGGAAQVIVSWLHPGPSRNDAAFAKLAGACPIPASSGRIQRHRLNRGGDRDLNRALHDILLTGWRICPRTHGYIAELRSQGRTDPEIRRCLKRYLARRNPPRDERASAHRLSLA